MVVCIARCARGSSRVVVEPRRMDIKQKMGQLWPMMLLLALAGCASSGDWFHQDGQARASDKPGYSQNNARRRPLPGRSEQKQFVSSGDRGSADRDKRERGRAHGLRDGILQNKLLAKSGRTIQTKMVRAI